MKIFGIVGWKNSGKTTLVAKVVTEIKSRGFSVSTIKHAHHAFDLDQPGRDSYKHREAGAREVMISSGKRWALMHELDGADQPKMNALVEKMSPVDLIIVEGFKSENHPKIECHRASSERPLICAENDTIVAVATDTKLEITGRAILDLNDVKAVANYILVQIGLET